MRARPKLLSINFPATTGLSAVSEVPEATILQNSL